MTMTELLPLKVFTFTLNDSVYFRNVYDNVKFLDIPTIKDVWKWRNGPELKELLGAPFDQKVIWIVFFSQSLK